MFDEGRFGPVYRSHDSETNEPVLVRTFAQPLTPDDQARLVDALTLLCESPLDHQSIARPLVAGIENGRPFLVHTLLPGESLQRFLEKHGPRPFREVVLRVTQLAAAIDFAAAAGVHHGDLGTRDVIVGAESTGISGFGVMQALIDAGVDRDAEGPTLAGDVEALARVAFEMLQGRAPQGARDAQSMAAAGADPALLQLAFGAALGKDPVLRPESALDFAAALQRALEDAAPVDVHVHTRADAPAHSGVVGSAEVGAHGDANLALRDFPLREAPDHRFTGDAEPSLPLTAAPMTPPPADSPLLRDERPSARPAVTQERSVPAPMFGAVAASERPREPHERSGWFLIAAALAIGIFSGFAAGFIVGQRGEPLPVPRFAADVVRPAPDASAAPPEAAAPNAPRGPVAPEPGTGNAVASSDTVISEPDIRSRDLDAGTTAGAPVGQQAPPTAVAAPPASDSPAPAPPDGSPRPPAAASQAATSTPPEAASPASGAANAEAGGQAPESRAQAPSPAVSGLGPRVPAGTPGGLQVLSRPAGAEVFVDGALVGRTPLVIASVAPGAHDIRIELAGHRQWATSVRVEPGARARVAASLEQ